MPTFSKMLWAKVGLDVVHMPKSDGKNYLVLCREDLSGWVEGRAIARADSKTISKFFWKDVICRHGCFGKLVIDGGPENKGVLDKVIKKLGIQ